MPLFFFVGLSRSVYWEDYGNCVLHEQCKGHGSFILSTVCFGDYQPEMLLLHEAHSIFSVEQSDSSCSICVPG